MLGTRQVRHLYDLGTGPGSEVGLVRQRVGLGMAFLGKSVDVLEVSVAYPPLQPFGQRHLDCFDDLPARLAL